MAAASGRKDTGTYRTAAKGGYLNSVMAVLLPVERLSGPDPFARRVVDLEVDHALLALPKEKARQRKEHDHENDGRKTFRPHADSTLLDGHAFVNDAKIADRT